jgi:hypothetical protein
LLLAGFSGEAERVRIPKAETLKTDTLKSQQRTGFAGAPTQRRGYSATVASLQFYR